MSQISHRKKTILQYRKRGKAFSVNPPHVRYVSAHLGQKCRGCSGGGGCPCEGQTW